jgi:hypothetical protein
MTLLRRWFRLPPEDRLLLLRAYAVLCTTRLALHVLPFRCTRRLLKRPGSSGLRSPVDRFVWGVRTAARYVPQATCLTQAISLQRLLAHAGQFSHVEIGVAKTPGFEAHAWVVCGGRILIGGEETAKYAAILSLEVGRQ